MSDPIAKDKNRSGFKFKLTHMLDDPSKFHLQGLETKTRLAIADVVRLHVGAIPVDMRLSMEVSAFFKNTPMDFIDHCQAS